MPIYFGENNIAYFYVKNDASLKVYKGETVVYTNTVTTTTTPAPPN